MKRNSRVYSFSALALSLTLACGDDGCNGTCDGTLNDCLSQC
jgi:hypothetical protein